MEVGLVKLLYQREIIGSNITIVRSLVRDMMTCISDWKCLDEEENYEFRLILNELIANGILHGNKGSGDKRVKVSIKEVNPNTLDISIKDEGQGFDHQHLCHELCEKNALRMSEGGRGLLLVSAFCNKIKFNEDGNHVKITKTICSR